MTMTTNNTSATSTEIIPQYFGLVASAAVPPLTYALLNPVDTTNLKKFVSTSNIKTVVFGTDLPIPSNQKLFFLSNNPNAIIRDVNNLNATSAFAKSTVTMKLASGADQTITALFLTNDYLEKDADIYKGFIDSNEALIADPFLLFKGRIEGFSINESLNNSQVNVSIASHWADFSKVEGRKTNTGMQQIHFPDDLGFEFASQTVQDIKWGRS